MATNFEQDIRKFLSPAIAGKFTNALIAALAKGDTDNQNNILAVKDNLFIATATGQYLDKIASSIGITRPPGVGIDDSTFAQLAVDQTNNKLVSNIFLEILELFYGSDAIKANTTSQLAEPYNLSDGMTLQILQDNNKVPLTVTFLTSQFSSIAAATATEIASVISQAAFNNGYSLTASPIFDSTSGNTYLQIMSGTRGPKSSITVSGGQAQNYIRFPLQKPTTQASGTQFTTSIVGSNVRFTWTSGLDPSLQYVSEGDYANIFGAGFSFNNRGSYSIVSVQAGTVGNSFFEIQNPAFSVQAPVTLSSANDLTFFKPVKNVIQQQPRYASVYEVNPYELIVFLPATTKIVKRDIMGSMHLHATTPDPTQPYLGSYIFNPKSGFSIRKEYTSIQQTINAGQVYTILNVQDASQFPDGQNYVVFDFGTSNQEGPVRYFGVPSSGTIMLDPSYKFQKNHAIGGDVTLIYERSPYKPATDGTDYQSYITGTIAGRIQAETLIQNLSAAGIFLNAIIVYPSAPGLNSITDVYGPDIT